MVTRYLPDHVRRLFAAGAPRAIRWGRRFGRTSDATARSAGAATRAPDRPEVSPAPAEPDPVARLLRSAEAIVAARAARRASR